MADVEQSAEVKGTESFTRQDNPVQVIIHDLTLAQLQAAETTPFQLIPAPGTNEFTKVLSFQSIYVAGSEAAEVGEDTEVSVRYENEEAAAVPSVEAGFVFDDGNVVDWSGSTTSLPVTISNKPVMLYPDDGTLTAGNGTLRLIIRFVQHSIA